MAVKIRLARHGKKGSLSTTSLPQIAERHVMVNSSRNWVPTIPIRILLRSI